MNVPKTYEEFLKTPKEELLKLCKISLSNEDASRIISFCDKFDNEIEKNNIIGEKMKVYIIEDSYGERDYERIGIFSNLQKAKLKLDQLFEEKKKYYESKSEKKKGWRFKLTKDNDLSFTMFLDGDEIRHYEIIEEDVIE